MSQISSRLPVISIGGITPTTIDTTEDKRVIVHPPEEKTEKEIQQWFTQHSTSETIVNHLVSQTTSIPQSQEINYVGDINVYAYMRKQRIDFASYHMRPNRRVYPFFDNKDISNLIARPNVIELDNNKPFVGILPASIKSINGAVDVIPEFTKQVDISRQRVYFSNSSAGFGSANVWADVIFMERAPNGNTRLYVSEITSDGTDLVNIGPGTKVIASYGYLGSIFANVVSYSHRTGLLAGDTTIPTVNSSSNTYLTSASLTHGAENTIISKGVITLSSDASSVDGYYVGNTITLVNSLIPGETSNIISYNGATKIAVCNPPLRSPFIVREKVIYTIGDHREPFSKNGRKGSHYTTEKGFVGGSFFLPSPTRTKDFRFRVGDKLLKITDNANNDSQSATTIAEYGFNAFGFSITKGQTVVNYYSNDVTVGDDVSIAVVRSGDPAAINPPATVGANILIDTITEDSGTPVVRGTLQSPPAQSFYVSEKDHPKGFYIPYIDLFFAKKGKLGVDVQIRPVINGTPDVRNILPGAVSHMEAEDINVSDFPDPNDANTYTRFTFNSPIQVLPGQEYCIVVSTNDWDYEYYVAELGEKIIGTDRLVSATAYVGSLFKAQSASVYVPIPTEDLMFVIHKCQFISQGQIYFHEEKVPDRQNGLFENYFDGNTKFDSFEVHSNIIELPSTNINFAYKATYEDTGAMDAEYLDIKPDRRILMNSRKVVSSRTIPNETFSLRAIMSTTTRDISPVIYKNSLNLYTAATIINNLGLHPGLVKVNNGGTGYTYTNTAVTVTGNNTSSANGTIFLVFGNNNFNIVDGIYFDQKGSGYSEDVTVSLTSSDGTGANLSIASETNASGGPAVARYISKTVTLAPEVEAGDLRVYLTAIRPAESDIYVYYKVKNAYDDDSIENKNWIKMERKTGKFEVSEGLVPIEFEYRPSFTSNNIVYSTGTATYDTFNQFKIKIVMASSSTSLVKIPYVYDMRAMALPADAY